MTMTVSQSQDMTVSPSQTVTSSHSQTQTDNFSHPQTVTISHSQTVTVSHSQTVTVYHSQTLYCIKCKLTELHSQRIGHPVDLQFVMKHGESIFWILCRGYRRACRLNINLFNLNLWK